MAATSQTVAMTLATHAPIPAMAPVESVVMIARPPRLTVDRMHETMPGSDVQPANERPMRVSREDAP